MYYSAYQDDESSYDEGDDQQDADNLETVYMADSNESAQDKNVEDGPSPGFAALVSAMILGWLLLGAASLIAR